jgi:hypothetical protein
MQDILSKQWKLQEQYNANVREYRRALKNGQSEKLAT